MSNLAMTFLWSYHFKSRYP